MQRKGNVWKRRHLGTRLAHASCVLLILTALLPASAQPSLAEGENPIVQKYRERIPQAHG